MNEQQVIARLDRDLNQEGREFGIKFDVAPEFRPDGGWMMFFVTVHDNGKRAAAAQIISDVEDKVAEDWGRELLLIRTSA